VYAISTANTSFFNDENQNKKKSCVSFNRPGHRIQRMRKTKKPQLEMPKSTEVADSKEENSRKRIASSGLRTGLLVVGSAFLGGIAVALWNRHSLAEMRKQQPKNEKITPTVDDDAIY
jgi:hypothetical protein